jgi:hypothetical protein
MLTDEQRAELEQSKLDKEQRALEVLRKVAEQRPEGQEPCRSEIVSRLTKHAILYRFAEHAHQALRRLERRGEISWRKGRKRGNDQLLIGLPKGT